MNDRAEHPGRWQAIHGGSIDELFVGAHVVDENGERGQIEELLGDDLVRLRLADGEVVEVRLDPRDPSPEGDR